MPDFIPYGHQSINEDDIKAVIGVLQGDWLTCGPNIELFETRVADYVGVAYAVAFSSGTAALHGAMHVAGVGEGDAVITTPLTFAATSNSVLYCGGTPVFADIDLRTLCLDPHSARGAAAGAGKRVRAFAPVSFAGYPVDIPAFQKLAKEFGATLIEDACHALGAERGLHKVGAEADMTAFSFHPVKHITTCEGGMVVTNSKDFAKKLRLFRAHGIEKDPEGFVRPYNGAWDNDMLDLGYNYRLSDMASVLGTSQMARLDGFLLRRREVAAYYRKLLADVVEDGLFSLPPEISGHAYHLFPIWVNPNIRKHVFDTLREKQIGVQVHYVPVHLHTYYKNMFGFREGIFPVAENYSAGEISLPIYPDMTDAMTERVVSALKEAIASAN